MSLELYPPSKPTPRYKTTMQLYRRKYITWLLPDIISNTPRIVKNMEECKAEGAEDIDAISTVKPTLDNICPTKDVIKKQPSNNSTSLVSTCSYNSILLCITGFHPAKLGTEI